MLDTEQDVNPPPSSRVARLLLQLKEAGQPLSISINGEAELFVGDATSFEMLLELVERLESIESVRRGLKEVAEGKGIPLEEVKARYGIPR
jgi:hypothetical protein